MEEIEEYKEYGQGSPIILLHGLFGSLSNWLGVIEHFSVKYRIIVPKLPLYSMPLYNTSLNSLTTLIEKFVEKLQLEKITLIGNSLGGHLAILYTLKCPEKVSKLVLTGSSGLFENSMGTTFPRRGDYSFIENKVKETFYDPNIVSKEFVDEIFEIVNSNYKALRIVKLARSAVSENLCSELKNIDLPTLLIWGQEDTITPLQVAYEFKNNIKNSLLHIIDKCKHVPMMEHPKIFNEILENFLVPPKAAELSHK